MTTMAATLVSVRNQLEPLEGKLTSQGKRRILFRGQSVIYPQIKSSFGRADKSCEKRVGQAYTVFRSAAKFLSGIEGFRIKHEEAAALLQHYGWPTPLIDLTGTVEVAVFFALYHARAGQTAVIYQIDCEALPKGVIIIDHDFFVQENHPFQNRWHYQDGFAIAPEDWYDAESCRNFNLLSKKYARAMTSYQFTVAADDRAQINNVLSIKNDRVAQKLPWLLKSYCKHLFGPLDGLDPELRRIIEDIDRSRI